jgi:hypothetical protein
MLFLTDRDVSSLRGVSPPAAMLHGSTGERTESILHRWLSDADGLRASKLEHAVQGADGDRNLSRTRPIRPRAQPISDHAFEAADGRLHQGSSSVPGQLPHSRAINPRIDGRLLRLAIA